MRYELKVNRAELAEGLNLLRRTAKPKKNMEAILSYEDGCFTVEVNGASIGATAEGEFPGRARIGAMQAVNLSKVLPLADPLTIAVDGNRLYIDTFSMPCVWHSTVLNPIRVPMDAPISILLGLEFKYSDQEIFQSGLSNPLSEARWKKKMLVGRAANALEPLGVTRADIEKLVDESLRRINKL
jgi:hypothetical protein